MPSARISAGVIVLVLAACRSTAPAPTTRPTTTPPPARTPTPEGEAFLAGCTCEQLNAPLAVPTDASERARWDRARVALDTVFAELAPLFPGGTCGPTTAGDVARVIEAHAAAIREVRALDAASCDHFTRWHIERSGRAGMQITEALRGGCELSRESNEQLSALLVTRGCTVTD